MRGQDGDLCRVSLGGGGALVGVVRFGQPGIRRHVGAQSLRLWRFFVSHTERESRCGGSGRAASVGFAVKPGAEKQVVVQIRAPSAHVRLDTL